MVAREAPPVTAGRGPGQGLESLALARPPPLHPPHLPPSNVTHPCPPPPTPSYVTDLGRVASHYYVRAPSVVTFSERLKPHLTESDALATMALSSEFESMAVRRVAPSPLGARGTGFPGAAAAGPQGGAAGWVSRGLVLPRAFAVCLAAASALAPPRRATAAHKNDPRREEEGPELESLLRGAAYDLPQSGELKANKANTLIQVGPCLQFTAWIFFRVWGGGCPCAVPRPSCMLSHSSTLSTHLRLLPRPLAQPPITGLHVPRARRGVQPGGRHDVRRAGKRRGRREGRLGAEGRPQRTGERGQGGEGQRR